MFEDRIIELDAEKHTGGGIDWPLYSADIAVCEFFLWGYVKDKVYEERIRDLEHLKERITNIIRNIPDDIRQRAILNFETRLQHPVTIDGKHFESLIH